MLAIGLVFLDDLHAFGPWISDRAPAWARARGLDGPPLPPTLDPPPVIIVVAKTLTWSQLESSAAWLRRAQQVFVILDSTGDPTVSDPDHTELLAYERNQLATSLQGRVCFLETTPDTLEKVIDEALRLARETTVREPWAPLTHVSPVRPVKPGPWIEWDLPNPRAITIELADVLRLLAPGLCRPQGRPALLDGLSGTRIDLQTGERVVIEGLAGASDLWRPIAAMPNGNRWLRAVERNEFRIDGATPGPVLRGGWGSPIGIDPSGKMAWVGGRCMFHFRALDDQSAAFFTPSSHDWPCGHGKKLYGYKDNEPLFVVVAANASACMSTYEHDTLLTPQLPLVWRDLGGFALAERTRGEPRALLFCRSDDDDVFPGDPFAADEDARDAFVVATLGPSATLRYTISLEMPTYRLAQDHVERLGGPENAWLVCNDRHEIVRRSFGRLLGGWGPWVVVEDAGQLVRENLTSGQRELLGPAERPVHAAVPLAGTPNVVLVNFEGHQVRLRLV
mgnify:CR=1 FL=1